MEKHDNEYQQKMMELVRDTFQLNAFLDNCAYHLDFYNLPVTQDIVHHKFAHLAPGWADEITEFLSTQGVRSVRLGLSDEITDYDNIALVFNDMYDTFVKYTDEILDMIEFCEFKNETRTKIFLENFVSSLNIYLKQTRMWKDKINSYGDDIVSFDKDFSKFTII